MNPKVLVIIIFLIQIWAAISNDIYSSKITRVECDFNKNYIKNTFCKLILQRNGSNLMSYGGELTTTISKVDLKVNYKFGATFKYFSFKFTKNICKDVKWAEKDFKPDAISRIFYNGLRKYSNVVVPCPYQGNVGVFNIPADGYEFPPIVPAGEYRIDIKFYNGENETYALFKVYAVVNAKGVHDLKMK